MLSSTAALLATFLVLCTATSIGVFPIKKLIKVYEAKHELKQGSAGFIRSISGWMIIVLWLFASWYFATICGDWWITGDLDGAIERSFKRLEILLSILQALGND
ncbi:hypothetical protein GCM10007939_02820 [Amylibacter marinus]|uniref:Uncharacterized protein n=1 Tax=Amylibacter marinus TaxID=1475483 RepID=A0ABQ5VRP0_9RHOB|nr:hypothetical protein [Amylibacter marinus]GLQ33999.1 hypothetical protein GCM10007939_02820 [Amylibacter marinus]